MTKWKKKDIERAWLRYATLLETTSMSQAEAYVEAGYSGNSTRHTVDENAYKLANRPEVLDLRKTVKERMRDNVINTGILSWTQRLEKLSEIANDPESSKRDIISAIESLTKHEGGFVTRTESLNINANADVMEMLVALLDKYGLSQALSDAMAREESSRVASLSDGLINQMVNNDAAVMEEPSAPDSTLGSE